MSSEKTKISKTKIKNYSQLFSSQFIKQQVFSCYTNLKTYIYSFENGIICQKQIRNDQLYSCFLEVDDKIFCGKAFGGVDLFQNQQFQTFFDQEQSHENFIENLFFHENILYIVGFKKIFLLRDEKVILEYSFKDLILIKSFFDQWSKIVIFSFSSDNKFFFDNILIDSLYQKLQNDNLEFIMNEDNLLKSPVSCIAMQNDGLIAALGLLDGSILVYKYKKQKFKQEFDLIDKEFENNYPNSICFYKNFLIVAWNINKISFVCYNSRQEKQTIPSKNYQFDFVAFNNKESLLYYSRSNEITETSVFFILKQ